MELGILALVQYNVHHRDSKAILGAFGKSLTPQHLNQHQRKTQDGISKVSYKLTFISILMIKGETVVWCLQQGDSEICAGKISPRFSDVRLQEDP